MLKNVKKTALLLVLSGVLSGFVLEQFSVFQQIDGISLYDSDPEQKDNKEAKKLGEDEKVGPKDFNLHQQFAFYLLGNLQPAAAEPDAYYSSGHTSIFTPPPERI